MSDVVFVVGYLVIAMVVSATCYYFFREELFAVIVAIFWPVSVPAFALGLILTAPIWLINKLKGW